VVPNGVDLVVVGSGPVGATFAREITEQVPGTRILMVDAGPRLTERLGENIRNLPEPERSVAQRRCQGPRQDPRDASATGASGGPLTAKPGTFLVHESGPGADKQQGMPAAAMASNVGGMAAHWTCACPKPGGSERIAFLDDVFDPAFERACELLKVTETGFTPTLATNHVLETLGAHFDDGRPPDRRVQPMPLACRPVGAVLPHWSGPAEVLGELAEPGAGNGCFQLADETICRRLIHAGGVVTAVELEHLPTATTRTVSTGAVVLACDALRTPQLLYASGIRPPALGRYLNDQPQIYSALVLDQALEGSAGADAYPEAADGRDQLTGVLWVPFYESEAPFHIQVMQAGTAPVPVAGTGPEHRQVIGWGGFTVKEIRAEDRIEFSASASDLYGMPAMTIHYSLTGKDEAAIAVAIETLTKTARLLGTFLDGATPRLLPAGSSMHYQGTVRMGQHDDGTSVCDRDSKVWAMANVYVGGNGVIPTAMACNPTATSVALAVLASRALAAQLSDEPRDRPDSRPASRRAPAGR
jgi:pyranose oxidase